MPLRKHIQVFVVKNSACGSLYFWSYISKYQNAMVQDDVWDIMPESEGQPILANSSRSTFLAKREC
jgi:hypothetical protein